MMPNHLEMLYSEADLRNAFQRLGTKITEWANSTKSQSGDDLIAIPIMRGGLFFAADLLREIPLSVEMHIVTARSYSSEKNSTPRLDVDIEMSRMDVHNRSVLIVDDICDSGRTLAVLVEKLRLLGAKEVRSAVMIRRIIENPMYTPDYTGFEHNGSEWLVGYGLEDRGRWRNLNYICRVIEP